MFYYPNQQTLREPLVPKPKSKTPTMISAEQYRQTIGRFAGGRGGKRKMITNKTLDRQYRQTSSISPFHLILYLSYSILILILLGSMSRCTSSLSCRELCMETGREEVGKSINQHYIWYANCVLTLVIFKSMGCKSICEKETSQWAVVDP